MTEHYLYHIRDAERSCGMGFDGYIGITDNPSRRKRQHFGALRNGLHPNERLQGAYNKSPYSHQFWIATAGSKEAIQARERLLAPKNNHCLNQQKGGGRLRGMSEEEAIRTIFGPKTVSDGGSPRDSSTSGTTGEKESENNDSQKPSSNGLGKGLVGSLEGVLVADVAAAIGVVAASTASGLGTAYALNKNFLSDSEMLNTEERAARKCGRSASYVGGGTGAVAAIAGVCAAGDVVGLGVAGVCSGLAALGGSTVVGAGLLLAFPAAAACVAAFVGYGGYKLVDRRRKGSNLDDLTVKEDELSESAFENDHWADEFDWDAEVSYL